MPKWVLVAWLGTACAWLGCAADADGDGGGSRGPNGGGGQGGGSAAGTGGAAGLDVGMPMPGTPGFGGGGGGGSTPMADAGGECGSVSQTAENMLQPVDIIIGVDTSGSMDDEIGFVQENLNAFSQQIIDSGVDVHVIMIATGTSCEMVPFLGCVAQNFICIDAPLGSGMCPMSDSNPPVYTHVNSEVGSNDILQVFIDTYPQYKDALRENSLKTFVAVTDDDATEGIDNADAFIAAVAALEPSNPAMWSNWRYSGIYCFSECADVAAAVGAIHAELVDSTMGVGGDLCLQDFAPVFDELATQVVETVTLECEWEIPAPPGDEAFDPLKTNIRLELDGSSEDLAKAPSSDACGDRDGWHYEDDNEVDPARVIACPATCNRIQSAQNARVELVFGCETMVFVPE